MWIPGDWMSVSTMPTRLPVRAIATARFAVVFDLPVPPRNEWIEMISVIACGLRGIIHPCALRSSLMADSGEFLSRDEVLGGLPARRARTLLFLIEQHSALHASQREVGTMAMLGERSAEARELEWIEAFALGRDAPRTASIREIEAAAGRWAPLVPESAEVRAATLQLLARHRLQHKRVPGIRAALGADDERVRRLSNARRESRWRA